MEPALPSPLRLRLEHEPVSTPHGDVSSSIQVFLAAYAARTGAQTSSAAEEAGGATAATGGVVASQLTRLMNGLDGKIDYAAFAQLISNVSNPTSTVKIEEEEPQVEAAQTEVDTPPPVLAQDQVEGEASFSRADEQADEQHNNATPQDLEVPHKKRKHGDKPKKIKKEKKDKHL